MDSCSGLSITRITLGELKSLTSNHTQVTIDVTTVDSWPSGGLAAVTSCPGRVDEIPKGSKQLSRYILDVYRWVFTLHYFVVFVKQKQPFASLQSNN